MWLRSVKTGSRIINHDKVLLRYRRRSGSLSMDSPVMLLSARKVFAHIGATVPLTSEEQATLEQAKTQFEGMEYYRRAKTAFSAGQIAETLKWLSEANVYLKSARSRMIILLLSGAPRFALQAYQWNRRQASECGAPHTATK
jgi:hypothetical protein